MNVLIVIFGGSLSPPGTVLSDFNVLQPNIILIDLHEIVGNRAIQPGTTVPVCSGSALELVVGDECTALRHGIYSR